MIQWILNLIFLFCFIACVPSNQSLTDLTGGEATTIKNTTTPSDLGNQAFQFTPTLYDFGNRAVNSAPISTTITIKNISSHTIYLSGMTALTGPYSLVSDTCPRSPNTIVPNQTCSATISFSPVAGGIFNDSLTLTYGESVATNTTYTAAFRFSGTGVGTLSFSGISSVSNIYSTQLKLNWTHVAGALMYYVFRVNADGSQTLITNLNPPTASYIVSGLTASTIYKYWVRATDTLGAFDTNANVVTTATNTTPPNPVITGQANYTFASMGAIAVGGTLSLNFDDVRTGVATDAAVTYSCAYDQVVNSSVTASGNCSSLNGSFSLSAAGALSWTPATQAAIGFYEFKATVTDSTSALTDAAIFYVDVRPAYTTTNLIGNFSAQFANATSSESTGTTWQDLTVFNWDGTLTNFSFGGSTGWLGAGTVASPYRLGFDGTNDYIDLGLLGNTSTSLTLESWYKPSQISTTPTGIIMSNADSSGLGLRIREAKGYRRRVEAVKGRSYSDEVLADAPVSYLRMGDESGDVPYDIGSGTQTWTPANIASYATTGAINLYDKAMQFNGTTSRIISNNDASLDPTTWSGISHEIWVNFSTVADCMLIGQGPENGTNAFFFMLYSGGRIYFEYTDGIGVGWRGVSYVIAFTPGTWYHLVTTFNFATRAYNLYINGVNVQSSTLGFVPILNNMTNKALYVGTYNGGGLVVNGALDEPALYNYVLSPARVTAHYNAKTTSKSCLSNKLDDSQWHHLAASYDDSSTSLRLSTNGNFECGISTSAISINGSSAEMSIGVGLPSAGTPTAGTFLKGEITDARVYSAALTTSQTNSNMNSQSAQFDIPKSISGLNLWMKADSLNLSDGASVGTWTDSSSNAFTTTQSSISMQPIFKTNILNGKPVVRFDSASTQYLNMGTILTKAPNFTVFSVFNSVNAGVVQGVFGSFTCCANGNAWATFELSRTQANGLGSYIGDGTNGARALSGAVLADNTFYYADTVYTAGSVSPIMYINGNIQTITTPNTGVAPTTNVGADSPFSIGRWGNYNAEYFKGDLAEIIIYNRALSESERKRVEGYLKAKYGL